MNPIEIFEKSFEYSQSIDLTQENIAQCKEEIIPPMILQ